MNFIRIFKSKTGLSARPRWLNRLLAFLSIGILVLLTLWYIWGKQVLAGLLLGNGPDFVSNMLNYHQSLAPNVRNLAFYSDLIGDALIRLSIMLSMVALLFGLGWSNIMARWKAFIQEDVVPHTLAIFRVICFSTLLYYPNYDEIRNMSELPSALLVAPPGWQGVLQMFAPNKQALNWLIPLYQIVCFAALVGFKTKYTAVLTLFLGLWILGIPQFYGKINHYHHLLWFAGIAAFSPSSQVWSIDSLYNKQVFAPEKHRYYFALIVLSMVVIYFFAGWWKLIGGGLSWLWGDAARWHLEAQALRLERPLPVFLNEIPMLYNFIGFFTVLFELSWGWWMLSKKTRVWMFFTGLLFHLSVYLVMDINFWSLAIFYLVFLPFDRWFKPRNLTPMLAWKLPKWHWSKFYLGLIVLFGFAHLDSWPLAVYPSFGNPPETRVWQVSLDYYKSPTSHSVALVGDKTLREWLSKTRLMGLHGQLTGKEKQAIEKIKALDPFYCEALGLPLTQERRYVKRKIDLHTGQVLEIRELWRVP